MNEKESKLLSLIKERDRKMKPSLNRYNRVRGKAEAELEKEINTIIAEFFKAKRKAGL